MKKTMVLTVLASTLLASAAQAVTQQVNLDMHGTHLRGYEEVPLKRMMRRQLGARAVRGWSLEKVKVEAKSKHGNAQISLLVGHNESLRKTIPGTPERFESTSTGYTEITLNAPYVYRGDGEGRMRLLVDGNVKLDDIKLILTKSLRYDYANVSGLRFERKVEFKADKLVGSSKTIRPSGRVSGISLVGTKGKVHIDKVEIVYSDGQKIILDELNGRLKDGRKKSMALRRSLQKPIRKIKVSASSGSLFGSRGKLAVELAR